MDQEKASAGPRARSAARERHEAERAEAAEKIALEAAEVAVEAARETDDALATELPRKVELVLNQQLVRQFSALVEQLREGMAGAAAAVPSPVGDRLTPEQEQLALDYDALRTALGRRGAASIVLYRIVPCDGKGGDYGERHSEEDDSQLGVEIVHGHIDKGSSIVIYGSQDGRPGGPYGEIGRAPYRYGVTCFRELRADQHIDRLEVHDRHGHPVRLGRPLLQHQPHDLEAGR
jgi:hypothetical protein